MRVRCERTLTDADKVEYGRAVVWQQLTTTTLEPDHSVIYDRQIESRVLYKDPASGAGHYLLRYPAGLRTRSHRHSAAHTMVILEGSMEVNGEVVGAGSYCHFPAGEVMRHAPAGDGPCLFVIIFDGPVDVTPVE